MAKLLLNKLWELEVTFDKVDLSWAFVTVNGLNSLAIDVVLVSYEHH
jgi:hypothetical protein